MPTTRSTSFYPLFLNLHGRHVLVIRGGDAARRKIARLLAAGAGVTWAADEVDPALRDSVDAGRICWLYLYAIC